MKKVVAFALIAAICAGALLYFYLGNLESKKEVKIEYDKVVVAAMPITAFTPITSDMVTFQQVPRGYAHPLAARSVEEVVGYVTENDIINGEQIFPTKLKQFGETDSGLSYVVPEGMRAVTVAVDEVSGVAGFLQRGDYVDVISYTTTTYVPAKAPVVPDGEEPTAAQLPQTLSTTLVAAQDVRIAAVGKSFSSTASAEDEAVVGYNSVTLLLTPEDAMRVVQGAKSGSIVLILRASGDHAENTQEPVINDMLLIQAQ
ncbi:MAG: Flp pilus assembly protein CpaB [Eubacteriales bacterium]|jgi:pilus assembly protein CpaB|nr:Flp pilus assembly protein CpaB [Eubacteriales bacterium]